MSARARQAIIQLAAAEMVRTVEAETEREKDARAAGGTLNAGTTLRRVLDIAMEGVKVAGEKMVDAHLSTRFFASDATIAREVRPELEPWLRRHLEAEGGKGYVGDEALWVGAVTNLLATDGKEYFDSLEAYVASRRHLSSSTRVDHALRAVKNYPLPATVVFGAIVIGGVLGWAKSIKEWAERREHQPCPDAHGAQAPAAAPTPPSGRP